MLYGMISLNIGNEDEKEEIYMNLQINHNVGINFGATWWGFIINGLHLEIIKGTTNLT